MRQYSCRPWIIAINVWAATSVGVFAAQSTPDMTNLPDYLWYREASARAVAHEAEPPVEVTSATLTGNLLKAHVEVKPWFDGSNLSFVVAAPAGDITTAGLIIGKVTDPSIAHPDSVTNGSDAATQFRHDLVITAKPMAYVRGHRLLKIRFPAIAPGSFGSRIVNGELQIAFSNPPAVADSGEKDSSENKNTLADMVRRLVANPGDVSRFAVPLKDVPMPADPVPSPPLGDVGDAVGRFAVSDDGFVRFTGADLMSAGLQTTGSDVSKISVWTNGEQQSVLGPQGARAVQPDDEFTLYARENQSPYTTEQVYWIKTGKPALAPRMEPAAVGGSASLSSDYYMARKVVEQDTPPVLTKNDQFLTILGYRWVWWTWTHSNNRESLPEPRGYDKPGSVDFDLPGLADAKASASLTFDFYAHHWAPKSHAVPFHVDLNGHSVGQFNVADPDALRHTLRISADLLTSASNHIVITPEPTTATQTLPDLCFDNLRVDYPRTYKMTSNTLAFFPQSDNGGVVSLDLTGTSVTSVLVADISEETPIIYDTKVTNGRVAVETKGPATRQYLALAPAAVRHVSLQKAEKETDLRSPGNMADLVVISWPGFIKDMQPWMDAKIAAGHSVSVVDVNDIYDQFGFGHQSPHAIRAFLRYAAVHWTASPAGPAASVVQLVGDSTSAYRNEFHNDVINYVPTMRMNLNGDAFASDQWYVTVFGDDPFADAMIGRFSVNSVEDLKNVVSKQLHYQADPAPGPWQNTLGFIADHSEFEEAVNRVMQRVVPPRFFLDKIIMSELPWIDNYYFPKEIADAQRAKVSPEATAGIRDMFNDGAAVVTYFGHGSPNIWSTQRMWFGGDSSNSDNLMLTNRDKLSLVINMTCNSGAIDYPQPKWNVCISEDFMRVPNGGTVACFVPSGPGLTVQHERMMMEIAPCLFGAERAPLGGDMQLALWRYLAAGNAEELARMYILLGDPLLDIHISKPAATRTAGERSGVTQWPGTVALPSDVAASKSGGHYQINEYNDSISAGDIKPFTTTTVAIPLPPNVDNEARALAVSVKPDDRVSSEVVSTFMPVSNLQAVELTQWQRTDDGNAKASLEFRIKNTTPLPLRDIRLKLLSESTDELLAESPGRDYKPFENDTVKFDVETTPGLMFLKAALSNGSNTEELSVAPPITIAGLRSEDEVRDIPPAVVDPRSIRTVYRVSATGVTATVSAQVYVLAKEPLSNLRVGLEDPDGVAAPDSITTVPPVGPGAGTRVSMSVTLPMDAASKAYGIRFDPSGFYPEFSRFPAHKISLGHDDLADIAVTSVVPSNTSPTDGETVFFDVTVANLGSALANGIRVEGFHITDNSQREKLTSQVSGTSPLFNLDPGTSRTIRMRWDPFQDAGQNRLIFAANSVYDIPDRANENNARTIGLNVRTKAMLYSVKAGVLPLRKEDYKERQIRFLAEVRNYGQTGAHNLRVVFYATKEMKPEDTMGEEEIDNIPAGATRQVILTYKLKPHEENRKFNITFEVMYQGSRQRVPLKR